jgi:hypothetical protein
MKVKINGKELYLDKIEFDFLFNPSVSHNDNIIAWTWDPWNCLDIYLDNFFPDEFSSDTLKEVNKNG